MQQFVFERLGLHLPSRARGCLLSRNERLKKLSQDCLCCPCYSQRGQRYLYFHVPLRAIHRYRVRNCAEPMVHTGYALLVLDGDFVSYAL